MIPARIFLLAANMRRIVILFMDTLGFLFPYNKAKYVRGLTEKKGS